mmetsp:Transcript_7152/g.25515  ORF Transcript_7152/g.25515 Transcript_7152/m.25515 type:complete len:504 (+) Transcript_7152:81-1592(+)
MQQAQHEGRDVSLEAFAAARTRRDTRSSSLSVAVRRAQVFPGPCSASMTMIQHPCRVERARAGRAVGPPSAVAASAARCGRRRLRVDAERRGGSAVDSGVPVRGRHLDVRRRQRRRVRRRALVLPRRVVARQLLAVLHLLDLVRHGRHHDAQHGADEDDHKCHRRPGLLVRAQRELDHVAADRGAPPAHDGVHVPAVAQLRGGALDGDDVVTVVHRRRDRGSPRRLARAPVTRQGEVGVGAALRDSELRDATVIWDADEREGEVVVDGDGARRHLHPRERLAVDDVVMARLVVRLAERRRPRCRVRGVLGGQVVTDTCGRGAAGHVDHVEVQVRGGAAHRHLAAQVARPVFLVQGHRRGAARRHRRCGARDEVALALTLHPRRERRVGALRADLERHAHRKVGAAQAVAVDDERVRGGRVRAGRARHGRVGRKVVRVAAEDCVQAVRRVRLQHILGDGRVALREHLQLERRQRTQRLWSHHHRHRRAVARARDALGNLRPDVR